MKTSKLRKHLCLWALLGIHSCNQPAFVPNLPEPASELEGTYRAESYVDRAGTSATYPVNGQTMMLKVIKLSKDSVRIVLEAAPNGDYSPGDTLVYKRLYVNQDFETSLVNKQQVSCVEYRINLSPNATFQKDLMRKPCKSPGIEYYYITPVKKVGTKVRFVKY